MRTVHREIVGAFIFSSDRRILLGKHADGGVYQGLWTVPGGGVEPGETTLEAVKREVWEEIGLDISSASITPIVKDFLTGTSEKTLRDTGETVIVQMRFNDFIIAMPLPAADMLINPRDEFAAVQWLPVDTLDSSQLAPGVVKRLTKLGYIN